MWYAGLGLFLAANIFGSTVQITTLPLVILSPLQAVGLVFNSICASVMLDEPFTKLSVVGTVLVFSGALMIAAFGTVPDPRHNLKELLELFARRQFQVWMAVSLLAVCVLIVVAARPYAPSLESPTTPTVEVRRHSSTPGSLNRRRAASHASAPPTIPGGDAAAAAASNKCIIKLGAWHVRHAAPMRRGMLYGIVSGVLSAHSLLMAKGAVEMVVRGTSNRMADFFHWEAWAIVGAFLLFACSQLYFLNLGLKQCSTSVLYPLVFCVFNVTSILNGIIYFDQGKQLTALQGALVALGTVTLLAGVLFLSLRLDHYSGPTAAARCETGTITTAGLTPAGLSTVDTFSPGAPSPHSGALDSSPHTERTPLLDALGPTAPQHYTSFRSISGASGGGASGGIPEPSSPYAKRSRFGRGHGRALSAEQVEILEQLR